MGQSPKGETTNNDGDGIPLLNGPTEFGYSYPTPTQFTIDPRKISKIGDLLFCVRGSTTGRMNFGDQPYAIGRGIGAFRGKNGYSTKYVKYLIDYHLDRMLSLCTGSTFPNLSRNDLENYKVISCEPDESECIASILSALDDKIELNLQQNKTLEEMAMALYKHWFVDFGPFKDGEFVESELGLIPEGWEVKDLSEFIHLNPRLSLPKGTVAPFVEMKALPIHVLSVSEIATKEFKGGAKFQNGDTLFARITPCLENGKTAFVDFLIGQEIAFGSTEYLVMRAKDEVSKYWVYCLARYRKFRDFSISTMVGTSGRQRVQNDPFLSYEMAKPTTDVFDSFTEIVEPWFKQIRANTIENQTLTTLRDSLLPKLISGEVRVKDVEQLISKV